MGFEPTHLRFQPERNYQSRHRQCTVTLFLATGKRRSRVLATAIQAHSILQNLHTELTTKWVRQKIIVGLIVWKARFEPTPQSEHCYQNRNRHRHRHSRAMNKQSVDLPHSQFPNSRHKKAPLRSEALLWDGL